MNEKHDSIAFVSSFFGALRARGIRYCILRNADEVAEGDAHDIDMALDVSRLREAEDALYGTAEALGWKAHVRPHLTDNHIAVRFYHFFKVREGRLYLAHFDLSPTFSWAGHIMLSNETLLQDIKTDSVFQEASPVIEAVCKLFTCYIYNGSIKDKYKPSVRATFRDYPERTEAVISEFLDKEMTAFILDAVVRGDWDEMEKRHGQMIHSLKRRCPTYHLRYGLHLLRKVLFRPGVTAAFVGADVGAIPEMVQLLPKREYLGNTFPPGAINLHEQPAPQGGFCGIAKCAWRCFRTYWPSARKEAMKDHLVLFRHYFNDYDISRESVGRHHLLRALFRLMVPEPDLLFVTTEQENMLPAVTRHAGHIVRLSPGMNAESLAFIVGESVLNYMAD